MRRRWILAVLLAGCGRFAFDEVPRTGDGGTDDDASDPIGDGALVERFAYIKPHNTETFDQFGYVIALSADGKTLAVGAPLEDGPGNTVAQSGAVYIFVRSGITWKEEAYLRPALPGVGDQFGIAVALSADGSTLAVGADGEDSNSTTIDGLATDDSSSNSGAAYVFVRAGTSWSQQAYIKAPNNDMNDNFGFAVALAGTGDVLVVSAPFEDSDGSTSANNTEMDSGAAYVFTRTANTWSFSTYLKGSLTLPVDNFGWALGVAGDGLTIVASAPGDDSQTPEGGAVYSFSNTAGWVEMAYVRPATFGFGDFFGRALALSGDGSTLAVGAPGDDSMISNSGAVFVFTRNGLAWMQKQRLKASNLGNNDQFGSAVAIDSDGSNVLVGAPLEDSDGAGLAGGLGDNDDRTNSGAVYSFMRVTADWDQSGLAKPAVPTAGDEFGNSIGISADGRARATASHFEDSAATGIDGDASDDTMSDSGSVEVNSY